MKHAIAIVLLATTCATPLHAQNRSEDAYTRYELLAPETASFKIIYDVTAVSPGVKYFFNPIRPGSSATDESVIDLMIGAPLKTEILRGAAITQAKIDIGEPVRPDSEIVLIRFPAINKGQTLRWRIEETYTDPARYDLIDGQLMWRRSFGRARNEMVLPADAI